MLNITTETPLESTKGRSRVDSTPSLGLTQSGRLGGALNAAIGNSLPAAYFATPNAARAGLSTAPHRLAVDDAGANQRASQAIADTLKLLDEALKPQRRVVHAGDMIYRAGERFERLHILNSGFVKLVNLSHDGREQVVGLKFRGDWLGFDGIANGQFGCDAVAMDTGEVWPSPTSP